MAYKKNIVCLGGGNGMPKAVLKGLKKYPIKITAVCAMLDSGGSSGRLRKDYGILSPGDLRRALIALADTSPIIEELFNYRFEIGELKGHNLANLLILALELSNHDLEKTIRKLRKVLRVKHEVLPVTIDNAELYAELENGQIIKGESNIDVPKHDPNLKIKKVYLKPQPRAYPKTIKAIEKADLVVIGPGDLYSSLAQVLLTKGVKEAISKSRAKIVYICNLMTKKGETNSFNVSDFIAQIEKWLEKEIDFVLYNNFFPSSRRVSLYKRRHPELLELVRFAPNLKRKKFLGFNLLYERGPIEHDPEKVAKVLINLCKQSS